MWHIGKMLFMLLLNSVQSLTVLTLCAQWMALAALVSEKFACYAPEQISYFLFDIGRFVYFYIFFNNELL